MNPKIGVRLERGGVGGGLPNHSSRTGALTFLPVSPPPSILSTSTPR